MAVRSTAISLGLSPSVQIESQDYRLNNGNSLLLWFQCCDLPSKPFMGSLRITVFYLIMC